MRKTKKIRILTGGAQMARLHLTIGCCLISSRQTIIRLIERAINWRYSSTTETSSKAMTSFANSSSTSTCSSLTAEQLKSQFIWIKSTTRASLSTTTVRDDQNWVLVKSLTSNLKRMTPFGSPSPNPKINLAGHSYHHPRSLWGLELMWGFWRAMRQPIRRWVRPDQNQITLPSCQPLSTEWNFLWIRSIWWASCSDLT